MCTQHLKIAKGVQGDYSAYSTYLKFEQINGGLNMFET